MDDLIAVPRTNGARGPRRCRPVPAGLLPRRASECRLYRVHELRPCGLEHHRRLCNVPNRPVLPRNDQPDRLPVRVRAGLGHLHQSGPCRRARRHDLRSLVLRCQRRRSPRRLGGQLHDGASRPQVHCAWRCFSGCLAAVLQPIRRHLRRKHPLPSPTAHLRRSHDLLRHVGRVAGCGLPRRQSISQQAVLGGRCHHPLAN